MNKIFTPSCNESQEEIKPFLLLEYDPATRNFKIASHGDIPLVDMLAMVERLKFRWIAAEEGRAAMQQFKETQKRITLPDGSLPPIN
jgi:hypothetical protein